MTDIEDNLKLCKSPLGCYEHFRRFVYRTHSEKKKPYYDNDQRLGKWLFRTNVYKGVAQNTLEHGSQLTVKNNTKLLIFMTFCCGLCPSFHKQFFNLKLEFCMILYCFLDLIFS